MAIDMENDLQTAWLVQQLTKLCAEARAAGVDLPSLKETAGIIDQLNGKAPHQSVASIPSPLVLYFGSEADRQEMIDACEMIGRGWKTVKI